MSNYTIEQTKTIIAVYKEAEETYVEKCKAVDVLASKYATSVHSIRAVLVQANIYMKKSYLNKGGKQPVTKDRFVTLMEDYFHLMPGRLESLTKANKTVLIFLMKEYIKDRGDPAKLFEEYI